MLTNHLLFCYHRWCPSNQSRYYYHIYKRLKCRVCVYRKFWFVHHVCIRIFNSKVNIFNFVMKIPFSKYIFNSKVKFIKICEGRSKFWQIIYIFNSKVKIPLSKKFANVASCIFRVVHTYDTMSSYHRS